MWYSIEFYTISTREYTITTQSKFFLCILHHADMACSTKYGVVPEPGLELARQFLNMAHWDRGGRIFTCGLFLTATTKGVLIFTRCAHVGWSIALHRNWQRVRHRSFEQAHDAQRRVAVHRILGGVFHSKNRGTIQRSERLRAGNRQQVS